jgi:hypothetical protein
MTDGYFSSVNCVRRDPDPCVFHKLITTNEKEWTQHVIPDYISGMDMW